MFGHFLNLQCNQYRRRREQKCYRKHISCTCLSLLGTDKELFVFQQDVKHISSRTKQHEVWLIIMRLLSVLMSRTKSNSKSGSEVKVDFEKCYSSCGEIWAALPHTNELLSYSLRPLRWCAGRRQPRYVMWASQVIVWKFSRLC